MIALKLFLAVEDLGGEKFLVHVGGWLLTIEDLYLGYSDGIDLLLFELVVLFFDALLSLDIEWAFGFENFNLNIICCLVCILCSDLVLLGRGTRSCSRSPSGSRLTHTPDSVEEKRILWPMED